KVHDGNRVVWRVAVHHALPTAPPAWRPVGARLVVPEREIDAALAGHVIPGRAGRQALETALDELLAAYASLRRGLGADLVGATLLRGLYRLWWRVDAV